MKGLGAALAAALLAGGGVRALVAAPEIADVATSYDAATRLMTVTYTLTEAAVVTAEAFAADGASLGPAATAAMAGAVNRVVPAGAGRTAWWRVPSSAGAAATVKLSAWSKAEPPDWMTVDLSATNGVRFYTCADAVPGGVTNRIYKTDQLLMRKITAKGVKWPMGTPADEKDRKDLEHQLHYVTLTANYYMAVYETTKRQVLNAIGDARAAARYGTAFSNNTGADWPLSCWSADTPENDIRPCDAFSYQNLRGNTSGYLWPANGHAVPADTPIACLRSLTGLAFDLPTEAQWEYACRAGTATATYAGDNAAATLARIAWYNSDWSRDPALDVNRTHAVGQLEPNAWGLYDMIGNVAELCLDLMPSGTSDANYDPYKGADAVDPYGPDSLASSSTRRYCQRGGYFSNGVGYCRSGSRQNVNVGAQYAYTGFRLVCPAEIP